MGDQEPEKSGTCGRVGKGDVIGCYLDLGRREVWFSKNGATVSGVLRLPHFDDDVITPAISMSSNVRYRLLYTVFCVLPHVSIYLMINGVGLNEGVGQKNHNTVSVLLLLIRQSGLSIFLCYSMVLLYGGSMGEFSHPPPSDYAGLCEAAPPSSSTDELRLRPFITLGTSGDLALAGPEIHASHEGFVPAPIDTGGLFLPGSLHGVRERLAQQLHEVWAKNKIDAGYTFSEVRSLE